MIVFMVILCAGISIGMVFGFFSSLKKYRIFSDTPESKIRSAAQGYNILCGYPRRLNLEPLISPLTKTPCCWYEYSISVDKKTKDRNEKVVIESETSQSPFCIDDGTGVCITIPSDATITVAKSKKWKERSVEPISTGKSRHISNIQHSLTEIIIGKRKYYYEEKIITSEDKLHVAGFFETMGEPSESTNKRVPNSNEGYKQLKDKSESITKFKNKTKFIAKFIELSEIMLSVSDSSTEDWETQIEYLTKKNKLLHFIGPKAKDSRPFVITTMSLEKTRKKLLFNSIVLFVFALVFGISGIMIVLNHDSFK